MIVKTKEELYAYLNDEDVIKAYLSKWFDEMNIKKYEIYNSDLPINTKTRIEKFIGSLYLFLYKMEKPIKIILAVLLSFFLFTNFTQPEIKIFNGNQNKTSYKVIGVKDGDTIVLLIDGKEQTVRFAHIDCPEKKQAFGTKAKQFVSDACFGKYVTLIINDKNKYDRNKRLIAEVILENGKNLNKELVKNGLAWHFKKYSDSEEYDQLEKTARSKKIGIWNESNPIAPWDWRKQKKTFFKTTSIAALSFL